MTETSSKYNIIWKNLNEPHITTNSDSEYASFLKNLERICSKTGYLDSKFYTQQLKSKSTGSLERSTDSNAHIHPYDIARNRDKFNEDYERQMKDISRALLEEKRKERILKRREGDIIKKEHMLNKSLYELDSEISSKKFQQDIKLNKTAEESDQIYKSFFYRKSKTTRERMKQSIFNQVDKAGKSRQSQLSVSKLLREFNSKKNELDTSTKDISKLMKDFEIQLAREENKHKRLQDELEFYSKALKREILKNQVQQEQAEREISMQNKQKRDEDIQLENSISDFQSHTNDGIKASEMERKILDSQLLKKTEDHKVKTCEYGGSLNIIRNKLRKCENTQRQLIENGNHFNLVLKNAESNRKIEEANSKKMEKIKTYQNEMITNRMEKENKYLNLSNKRKISMDLEDETENVEHFKHTVQRDKENEKKYFKGVSDTGKDIKQLSIAINRLSKQLHDAKVVNSSRINEEMRVANKHEQQLEEELNKLKTRLIELQNKRNNFSVQLLECRKYLNADQYYLQKSERNQSRLNHIREKTDEKQPFLPILA